MVKLIIRDNYTFAKNRNIIDSSVEFFEDLFAKYHTHLHVDLLGKTAVKFNNYSAIKCMLKYCRFDWYIANDAVKKCNIEIAEVLLKNGIYPNSDAFLNAAKRGCILALEWGYKHGLITEKLHCSIVRFALLWKQPKVLKACAEFYQQHNMREL